METEETPPRAVYIRVGIPPEMKDDEAVQTEDGVNIEDCYMIDFAEEGAEEGFCLFCACLCMLPKVTEAWLTEEVNTHEEMLALVQGHKHE